MKFLFGLLTGAFVGVFLMNFPQAREWSHEWSQGWDAAWLGKFTQTAQPVIEDESSLVEAIEIAREGVGSDTDSLPGLITDLIQKDTQKQEPLWADELELYEHTEKEASQTYEQITKPAEVLTSAAETSDVLPSLLPEPLFYAVWSPFRSELSAKGFARKLTVQTSRRFRVVRTPDGYQVGFDYSSDHEKAAVAAVVDRLTGGRSNG